MRLVGRDGTVRHFKNRGGLTVSKNSGMCHNQIELISTAQGRVGSLGAKRNLLDKDEDGVRRIWQYNGLQLVVTKGSAYYSLSF